MLRKADMLMIPFSLFWGGFAIFWEYNAIRSGSGPVFILFGSVFVAIGLYIIAGRFFHDIHRRRGIIYGLSDKRMIFLTRSGVKSVHIDEGRNVEYQRHGNGRGTLQFGRSGFDSFVRFYGSLAGWSGRPVVPTFQRIEDSDCVYAEVKRLAGM